jgi:hypothetical protein
MLQHVQQQLPAVVQIVQGGDDVKVMATTPTAPLQTTPNIHC